MFGLTFGNPIMLYGLGAALLPILIHLLNRTRTVTVAFSNVALLQTLQQDRMKQVRLKQILLLLIRTIIIALLALAFSRPTLPGLQGRTSGNARSSAVILIDRSLSMRHRTPSGTLFERSRERLSQTLDLFDDRDEVKVFLVDDRVESLETVQLTRLKYLVGGLQPSFRSSDFRAGMVEAVQWLSQSETLNRELFLFSDFARNGWKTLQDSLQIPERLSVFLVPERPSQVNNLGIAHAGAAGQILTVGSPATVDVELVNYGEEKQSEVPVQVYLGSRRIAQQVVYLLPNSTQNMYVRFVPEAGGAIPLRAEIGNDDLAADNTYRSILNIPDRIQILLVGQSSDETYFLEQAFQAASNVRGTVSLRRILPDHLTASALDEVDAIFLCNVARLTHGSLTALSQHVKGGAGLTILLGDRVDIRHYNERILPEQVYEDG